MRYIGFDVGDGESAIAAFEQGSGIEPVILPVGGSRSFLSAVGMLNGEIVVGERAYTDEEHLLKERVLMPMVSEPCSIRGVQTLDFVFQPFDCIQLNRNGLQIREIF